MNKAKREIYLPKCDSCKGVCHHHSGLCKKCRDLKSKQGNQK